MRGFQPKNSGAYRTVGGISGTGISYGRCEICGGAYQLSRTRTGMGSYSRPRNYEEIRDREKAASDIAEKMFTDPNKRCICDPDGGQAGIQDSLNTGVIVSNTQSVSSELAVGDFVSHAVFGNGTVVDIKGIGDTAEISVRFESRGVKNLALAWAPLEKIPKRNIDSTTDTSPSVSTDGQQSWKSIAEQLGQLWELFNAGALTSDQFESAKNLLLGKSD